MWQQLQRATTLLKDYGVAHQLYGPGQDRSLADAQHLHPLLALAEDGVIGSVASHHYSFMGATDPRAMEGGVRELSGRLKSDAVDTVLLVPV